MSAALSPALHPDIERLALLGWRMVPVSRNRAGFWKGYVDSATSDLDQLAEWGAKFPGCNWVVIPEGSGVWALDVDVPPKHEDGVAALRALCERHGQLPPRPHGRSGSGGHLLIFKATPEAATLSCASGYVAKGLDAKARRNSFTIAPSRNGDGLPYRWTVPPWEVEPPAAPAWLLRLLVPKAKPLRPDAPRVVTEGRARRALARAVDEVMRAGPGTRNATLNRAAFTAGGLVAGGALDQQEAVCAIYAAGRYIGLDDLECRATIKSGLEGGARLPIEGRRNA
ncbi:bifunctional DNA primase/polymerase [Pseudoroseomonas cervicalis]|uniref:bifunctional DNA primase/polymerase n=1 Tax=Teichococcus cervicalis TaxID=204525 RepID=UPI002782A8A8|nr:bifunctional DNA primase/polymerase [Pseudoroseomonas cervicalis]MDQ1077988.1 hypothetical protein [Pseudoroseomonas cervicalis]